MSGKKEEVMPLFNKRPTEVDNLTICIEDPEFGQMLKDCEFHSKPAVSRAVVRHEGRLCHFFVSVCEDLDCPEKAIKEVKYTAIGMIQRGELRIIDSTPF